MSQKETGRSGTIYVVGETDGRYYKIGFTQDKTTGNRLKALQFGNPRKLRVVRVFRDQTEAIEGEIRMVEGSRCLYTVAWTFEKPDFLRVLAEKRARLEWTLVYRTFLKVFETFGVYDQEENNCQHFAMQVFNHLPSLCGTVWTTKEHHDCPCFNFVEDPQVASLPTSPSSSY